MPRHKLTAAEKIRGLKKAIASPRTPDRLKVGLRRYLQRLEGKKE